MNVGDTLSLSGKTKHGRNRVREQGALWKVTRLTRTKRHSIHPEGTSIVLLRALDNAKHWRWIKEENDINFSVEVTDGIH